MSVILPTYARGRSGMLERAMRSVLAQTFDDFELLVVDDGSTDGSAELIRALQASDPRIVHVRHEWNCGLPALRVNEGIELARGRYLAFQFDDDSWRPRALEALVRAAEQEPEPSVVVGRCRARGRKHELTMPFLEVTLTNLMITNFIGNNSVLVPLRVVNEHGMYDCHIGMRRLCDWDLWQRLIQHVPFVPIDEVVSDVFAEQPDSVGMTMPYDLALVRCLQAIERNALLTPARWREYEIDALTIGDVSIAGEYRRRLYEDHIVPYYLKFRHRFPRIEGFPTRLPGPRRSVVYARPSYDALNEMAFNHYDRLTSRRDTYKACFQYSQQMERNWVREADAAVLVRPLHEPERAVAEHAVTSGRPTGVYLDDDFLGLHEYGPPFDFVAPGTTNRRNLVEMLERADAVWVTSPFIADSVRSCTQRIVPHALAIPEEWLPDEIQARGAASALRIGYVGTSYRLEEFRILWDALVRLSAEHGPRLEFEFWGLDISSLTPLSSPVRQVPYEASYFRFLDRLRSARFDILLSPLLDHPRARLAKNAHKYFHVAVAGALGIFSRVPPYARLPEGLTCLKAENTPADWYRVLREAVAMPTERFDLMRRRALQHVREEFTAAAQIDLHEAAWRATEWHARTRPMRGEDGRPRVVTVVGELDGEVEVRLGRWQQLLRQYGVEPVMVLGTALAATVPGERFAEALAAQGITCHVASLGPEDEAPSDIEPPAPPRHELAALLERVNPALVHSFGFVPLVGQICSERRLAHVASLYALEDDLAWPAPSQTPHCAVNHSDSLRGASQWRERLGSESFCAREVVPLETFDLGLIRHLESLHPAEATPADRVRMVVFGPLRDAGGQLEAIAAVAELREDPLDWRLEIEGDLDVDPEYVKRCRALIESAGLGDRVVINVCRGDVVRLVASADIVLSPARSVSFPLSVKEAMAVGALVVATPVGGVPELVIDGVSGIVCADGSSEAIAGGIRRAMAMPSVDRRRLLQQARRVAHTEFHWQRGASDLFSLYNRVLDVTQGFRSFVPETPWSADCSSSPGHGERIEPPAQHPVSHIRLHGRLTYHLVPRARGWCGLDVLVGTHQQPAHGFLELTVLSPAGPVVRAARADLTTIRDNDWVRFEFAPIANAVGRPFVLRFGLTDPGHRTKLSLYDVGRGETSLFRRALRRLRLAPARDSLYCRTRFAQ